MEEVNKSIGVIKTLKQVMSAVKQSMQYQFKKMNLTEPQGVMMGILAHYGEMKVSELSEKMGLSNSTISGIIDRLEKQGLVERVRSKEDRRVIYVSVTSEFKKYADECFREIENRFEAVMQKATPEEQETVINGLEILKRLIEDNQEDLKNR